MLQQQLELMAAYKAIADYSVPEDQREAATPRSSDRGRQSHKGASTPTAEAMTDSSTPGDSADPTATHTPGPPR
jgi:hypothetical protein